MDSIEAEAESGGGDEDGVSGREDGGMEMDDSSPPPSAKEDSREVEETKEISDGVASATSATHPRDESKESKQSTSDARGEEDEEEREAEEKKEEVRERTTSALSPPATGQSPPLPPLPSSPNRSGWLRPPPPRSFSPPASVSLTLTLAARHLPPSIDPILCLLQPDGSGERLLSHTEVHRQSMSPQWKKRLTVDWVRGHTRQLLKLAVYDASHIQQAEQRSAPQRSDDEDAEGSDDRRGSLLFRLIRRRSGRTRDEAALDGLQAGELTSDDLVGGLVVDVSDLCQASRHFVAQRLPIRHPFDAEIDRRLHRLSAHVLVTVRPSHSSAAVPSPRLSPRLTASASTSGPSCSLPFPAAYRLLCQGCLFLKFPFSSDAKPQPRLVFFSRHPLSPAQLAAQNHPLWDPLADSSPPNPLFPLGLLYWCSPARRRCSDRRCLPLHSVTGLFEQCQTAAFASLLVQRERAKQTEVDRAAASFRALECSFSVVSRERTLDLVADSREVRDAFVFALHSILVHQGRCWYADASQDADAKEEEKRRYNERQTEHTVAVSFAVKHLPLQPSEGAKIRLVLSRAAAGAPAGDDHGGGGSDDAAVSSLYRAGERRAGQLVGQSEWVDVDDCATFLTLFFLPLPDSPSPIPASDSASYDVHLYDLSHTRLAHTSFPSALLLHPHLDIPLSLRHDVQSVDSLLTFNRSCCMMRVKPIAGVDTKRGDILDVITLLQSQPSYNPSLPYLTLSFMLRGEECTYYPEPSFLVQPTSLTYSAATGCLSLGGVQVPLSSIVTVHRQLRPASALTDALCAVHPEKRIHSKRMLVIDCADEGRHVLEMRTVLSADAWVCAIRQLRRKKGLVTRAQMEAEELNWRRFGGPQQDDEDDDGDRAGDDEAEHRSSRSPEDSLPSIDVFRSPSLTGDLDDWERDAEAAASPNPWLRSQAADRHHREDHTAGVISFEEVEEEEEEEEEESQLRINEGRWSYDDYRPASGDGGRSPCSASGLESPDFHSRASSFSSLDVPSFHLHSPSVPTDDEDSDSEEALPEAKPEPATPEVEEVEAPPPSDEVPLAPPLIDPSIPMAPPLDGSADPSSDAPLYPLGVKMKRLHWDALLQGSEVDGTIFSTLDSALDAASLELLVSLFSDAPPVQPDEDEAAAAAVEIKKPVVVNLIDPRRAQNISIALTGSRLPIPAIVAALLSCDAAVLSVERLQSLIACHPDAVEAKQVKAYTGDEALLGLAERYIRAVAAVPRCATRLQVLLFLATWNEARENLGAQCRLLTTACEELRGSGRVASALQVVLAVGNALNAKRAAGFHLSSLDRLSALRSHSASFSLLDFVVDRALTAAQVEELCPPTAADGFFAALTLTARLPDAVKCDWAAVTQDLRLLSEQLRLVKREHDREDSRAPAQLPYYQALHSFLKVAIPQLAQLEALHRSTDELLQSTQRFFGEPPSSSSSPSQLLSLFQRFFANFAVSEGRYWQRQAQERKRLELEERKRQWRRAQEEAGGAVKGAHLSAPKLSADGQHIRYAVSDSGEAASVSKSPLSGLPDLDPTSPSGPSSLSTASSPPASFLLPRPYTGPLSAADAKDVGGAGFETLPDAAFLTLSLSSAHLSYVSRSP